MESPSTLGQHLTQSAALTGSPPTCPRRRSSTLVAKTTTIVLVPLREGYTHKSIHRTSELSYIKTNLILLLFTGSPLPLETWDLVSMPSTVPTIHMASSLLLTWSKNFRKSLAIFPSMMPSWTTTWVYGLIIWTLLFRSSRHKHFHPF